MPHLAERMSKVEASPTLKVAAEAERLRSQGVDIVDLGAGEPDFPTPAHVVEAARQALDAPGPGADTASVALASR